MIAKDDVQQLVNMLLPFAEKMLKEEHEFYPFGGYMKQSRKLIWVSAQIKGDDHPTSTQLIDLLKQKAREKALRGDLRAVAIVFDVRIRPPNMDEKVDAIQICLDHIDNYSIELLFPYFFDDHGSLIVQEPFAQKGDGEIFRKKKNIPTGEP